MKNETLGTIDSLRSVHWTFTDRKVAREDVETIIRASQRAANSDNLTDYSVIVVEDPAVIAQISGNESLGKSVTCLVYAMDHTRIIAWAKALGYEDFHPMNDFYNFNIAMYDVCAAAQTAVIAAKSLGIDSLVTNFIHRSHPAEVQKILNLPEAYCFPVMQVVLGYSDLPPGQTTGRLPAKYITHWGTYQPPTQEETQEMIQAMDRVYPDYLSADYPHALDWYFKEWLVEHYPPEMYAELTEVFRRTGLLREPGLCPQGPSDS